MGHKDMDKHTHIIGTDYVHKHNKGFPLQHDESMVF